MYSVDDLFGTVSTQPSMVTFHLRGDPEVFDIDKTYLDYIENQKSPTRFIFESSNLATHSDNIVSS